MGKIKKGSDGKPVVKYDYNAYTVIVASRTRPCLNCGRNSTHKKSTCNK